MVIFAVGGLVGWSGKDLDSLIINSYATGKVSGHYSVGGFVGYNSLAIIRNSFATGDIDGRICSGGFVGSLYQWAV